MARKSKTLRGIKLLLDTNARDRLPERLFLTCGWTPDTPQKRRVQAGCGRCSGMDRREIVCHPKKLVQEEKGPGRPFLPKRWIVEGTFAWLSQKGG
jgi:hypothetical protein